MNKFVNYLKKIDYKKEKWIIISGVFLILFGFYTYHTFLVDSKKISLTMRIMFMYGYYICSGIYIYIVYKLNKNKFKKIEKKFLLIALTIGTMYAFLIPSLAGTDEPSHFYRAYQICQGDIIPYKIDEYKIPRNIVEMSTKTNNQYSLKKIFSKVSNEKITTDKDIASYSPIQYIPQIIAISISNLFNLSPLVMLIFTRLSNLFIFLFLAYKSIKIMPYKKEFLTILLLSPAVLSLVSTASGDVFCLGIGFLFIAYVLKFYDENKLICQKQQITLFFLALILSSFKTVYILLILILFILPTKCFGLKKNKFQYLFIVFVPCILLNFGYRYALGISSLKIYTLGYLRVLEQTEYVKNNIVTFFEVVIRTGFNNLIYYLFNITSGREMCYGYPQISQIWQLGYFVLFIIAAFIDNKKYNFNRFSKYLFWTIFFITFVGISYVMYTGWTPIVEGGGFAYPIVLGVQSRYFWLFLPLIILTIPKISQLNVKLKKSDNIYILCAFLNIVILIETITSIYQAMFL